MAATKTKTKGQSKGLEFKPFPKDGAHNIEVAEDSEAIYFKVVKGSPTVESKNGKAMLATSRGWAGVGDIDAGCNINIMAGRNKA